MSTPTTPNNPPTGDAGKAQSQEQSKPASRFPTAEEKKKASDHLFNLLAQAEKNGLVGKQGYNPFFRKTEFETLKRTIGGEDAPAAMEALAKALSFTYSDDLFAVDVPRKLEPHHGNPESKPANADAGTSVVKVPLT